MHGLDVHRVLAEIEGLDQREHLPDGDGAGGGRRRAADIEAAIEHADRLSQLGAIIRAFGMLAARHRGEITAEVTSARPLDAGQVDALKANLKSRFGSDIAVDLNVDPAILGGLVVKVGSRMIDGSVRTKLNTLAQAMKG